MLEIIPHPEDQPDIITDRQFAELEEQKRILLSKCKHCNGSGYKKGGVMCVCMKQVMLKYRMLCSNIPREYHGASFDQFHDQKDPGFLKVKKYVQKLENARKNGIGLHIHTRKPGSGKTLLATCVLMEAMNQGYYVWFTSLEQLTKDIKKGFKDKKHARVMEWVMFHVDFLLLDEVAKFQSTEWKDNEINDLIQRRVNEKLPILTTENLSLDQMQEKHPEHLISRFSATQIEVTFHNIMDFRKEVKKNDLMKKLMEN